MTKEKDFLSELNIFRNEALSAQKFVYTEIAIHNFAGNNKKILDALNYSPTFWNTILSALQHAVFITIGRIFDINSEHNIHILVKTVENNKDIFTKEAFSKRWLKNRDKEQISDYLPQYLKGVYEPTNADFRALRKSIKQMKKEYEKIYRPIRHQFGHNKFNTNEETEALFNKVQIKDLEKFCVSLGGIHEILWQLYHNGHGTPLLPIKCEESSTDNLLINLDGQDYPGPANVQFIRETESALNLLSVGLKVEKENFMINHAKK
jgi:hypothetical protein